MDKQDVWYVDAGDNYAKFVRGTKYAVSNYLKYIMRIELFGLKERTYKCTDMDELEIRDYGDTLIISAEYVINEEYPDKVEEWYYTAKRLSSLPILPLTDYEKGGKQNK